MASKPSKSSPSGKFFRLPRSWGGRLLLGTLGVGAGLALSGVLLVIFIISIAYPQLPSLEALTEYRPKVPLRIFTADGTLIGEFGEERRNIVHINDIPDMMKKAVLAIEDERFYEHRGVDYFGIARAALNNLTSSRRQGASTITQQVARNFFLSSEQTYKRKLYEVLLAWKIEQHLTKDQILEIYMNQIYLGQRAFGFSSAAQIYYGKLLSDISLAEAAMLAGLPKAPSTYNPVVNPKRATIRQQYILKRMHELGYISTAEYDASRKEEIKIKQHSSGFGLRAEYAAEMARQLVYNQFKDEAYTRGLNVYTTILKSDQEAAYAALRKGILDYDRRQGYRGPESYMDLPGNREELDNAIDSKLAEHPSSDGIIAAVVLEAAPKKVKAILASGEEIVLSGAELRFAASALNEKAAPKRRIRRGAVIRVVKEGKKWAITQLPEVEAAFVSLNTYDGAIRALVGGFDFNRSKFNNATQAWRQPGSAFKPFIYSAALERGLSPSTVVNDAPITFDASQTGGQTWEPKNYDGTYQGPMTMRTGLARSKNSVSIRILHNIGSQYGQEFAARFGFDPDKNPPYLTLALGAGVTTPLQLASAYSVFANGGYKVNPYLISKITDANGNVISQANPPDTADNELSRVIDERNAFVTDSMLRDVVRRGTATKAQALERPDIAGKTGTTNDSIDAWFAGYHPKVAAVAWMGYSQPRNLGSRETGGGLALPIWMDYMQTALKGMPVEERTMPPGVIESANDYVYEEYADGSGVRFLGLDGFALGEPGSEDQRVKEEVKNEIF
jgi:penicillin-binding protein 1A